MEKKVACGKYRSLNGTFKACLVPANRFCDKIALASNCHYHKCAYQSSNWMDVLVPLSKLLPGDIVSWKWAILQTPCKCSIKHRINNGLSIIIFYWTLYPSTLYTSRIHLSFYWYRFRLQKHTILKEKNLNKFFSCIFFVCHNSLERNVNFEIVYSVQRLSLYKVPHTAHKCVLSFHFHNGCIFFS